MPIVELPDGTEIEFPDTMSQGEIENVLRTQLPSAQAVPPQRGAGGLAEKADAFIRGVADAGTFGFADELTARANALVPLDAINNPNIKSIWSGGSWDEVVQNNLEQQRAIDAYDEQNNKLARLPGQFVGGVASGIATGGAATGLRGAGIAAAQGGAYGLGSGEGGVMDRLDSAAVGAGGGLAGYGLGRAVARVLNPQTRQAAKELIEEGVPLTPGQIFGGRAARVEDKLTSYPVLGGAIQGAKQRSIEGFNKAAVNRALKPIGKKLPDNVKVGHDAVDYAQTALSEAYESLLPKLTVKADKAFATDLDNLMTLAREMPEDRFKQFQSIIQRHVVGKFSQNGTMSGHAMKEAESELGRLAREYGKSQVGDERLLANAIREAQAQIRQLVERSNPAKAMELKAINKGFANLLRVERAAANAAGEGVFTPGQLQTATRVLDASGRKKASAAGRALMQDLATNAREVLPSSVPNSGTAERLLLPLAIAGAGGYATTLDDPRLQMLGAVGLLGGAAYSQPGQAIISRALTQRPEIVRELSGVLGALPLAVPGGVLAAQQAP